MYSKFCDPCISYFEFWTPLKWELLSGKAVKAVIKSILVRDLKLKSHWSGHRLELESVCVVSWMNWTFRVDKFIKAVLTEETVSLFQGPPRWICLTVEVSCVPASSSS